MTDIMETHRSSTGPPAEPDIRQLWPADVPLLRLAHHRNLDASDAVAMLVQAPGASHWIPSTGEFALVVPWRHRIDLLTIHTLRAFANERVILGAVTSQARRIGTTAVVIVDTEETRRQSFYDVNGFRRAEEIVTYEHHRPRALAKAARQARLRFVQVLPRDRALLGAVHQLDNESFPWLWWNSRAEFDAYVQFPGVEIWAGFVADRLVAYVGTTSYPGWAHLDRIATHPDYQGQGLGRESLLFAVQQMVRQGARTVSLSTQGNNARSRALYEDVGFVRTLEDDYTIHAAVLDESGFMQATRGQAEHRHAAHGIEEQ